MIRATVGIQQKSYCSGIMTSQICQDNFFQINMCNHESKGKHGGTLGPHEG